MKAQARLWLQAALIVLAGAWVYSPALQGNWLSDDRIEVADNPDLREPGGLANIWLGTNSPDYFPLKGTVQWVEWHLWGGHVLGYHLVSLALHLLGACLLWRLLARLKVRWAWLGGYLFAVHPLGVESAAWISELKNVLSLPLLLAAVIAYLEYDRGRTETPARGNRQSYLLALGLFLLAMLSKSSVAMLPAVLLLHAWWRRGRIERRDWLAAAPFFAVSVGLGLVTVWFQQHRAIQGLPVGLGGFGSRLAAAGVAAAFYLGKSVMPLGLLFYYPRWALNPLRFWDFLPGILLATAWGWLAIGAGSADRPNWRRHALFGLGWFSLNLVPVLGFVPMAFLRFSRVADHLAYLPIAGVIGLAAAALGGSPMAGDRRMASAAPVPAHPGSGWGRRLAAIALGCSLAWSSHRQAAIFHDERTLWQRVLSRNEDAWPAQLNLGNIFFEDGRLDEAIGHYRAALRANPGYGAARLALGTALMQQGHLEAAAAEFEAARRADRDDAKPYYHLGNVLLLEGRTTAAIENFETAVRLDPALAEAHNDLAKALLQSGRLTEASAHLAEALRLAPDLAEAHYNLGLLLQRVPGKLPEAIDQFEAALQLEPANADAHNNLGIALAQSGRLAEAIDHFAEAVHLAPASVPARKNLGHALLAVGRVSEAIDQYRQLARLAPDDEGVRQILSELTRAAGRSDPIRLPLDAGNRFPP